jgi:hypothetical protein
MSDGYIDAAPGEEPEERGSFFFFSLLYLGLSPSHGEVTPELLVIF